AAERAAGQEDGQEHVAPVENLRVARRDAEQVRKHLVARDVEDLSFEGVEDPAGRCDREHQPLVRGDVLPPGSFCGHRYRGAASAAGAMRSASCWAADFRPPSTMSWPQAARMSRPRLLRTSTRTPLSARIFANAF